MLSNVLFPAPEGPIIAVSSPDLKWPLTFLRMSFSSKTETKKTKIINQFDFAKNIVKYYKEIVMCDEDGEMFNFIVCLI